MDGSRSRSTGLYVFGVKFTDDLGQSVTVGFEVIIQPPPTATGGRVVIEVGQNHTFQANPKTPGSISAAKVTTKPTAGQATVNRAGKVVYKSGNTKPGTYKFTTTFTDNLGQTGNANFTITIVPKHGLADTGTNIAPTTTLASTLLTTGILLTHLRRRRHHPTQPPTDPR